MARTKRFPVRAYPGNGVKVHDMTDKLHDAFDAALAKRNKENKPVAEVLSICICCNTLLPIDKFRKVPEDIGGYHTECILCEHMLENNEIDHKPIFPPECPECGDETAPWAFFPNANWKRELCVNCFFSKEENVFTAPNIPRPVDPCESDPRYNMPLKWQVRKADRDERRKAIQEEARRRLQEIQDESDAEVGALESEKDEDDEEPLDDAEDPWYQFERDPEEEEEQQPQEAVVKEEEEEEEEEEPTCRRVKTTPSKMAPKVIEVEDDDDDVVEVPKSDFLKGKRPADSPPTSEEPVVKKEKVFRGANPSQRFRAGPSGSNPSMRPCSMKGD
eukprot:jgi/Mesvir1/10052/Mv12121-RA.1